MCTAPLRGADDRPNKASQGLGPSLLALPLPLPFQLPPAPLVCHHTPCGHMWSDPNRTQLDSHLPCCTGRTSTVLSENQCSAPDDTAAGRKIHSGGRCVQYLFVIFSAPPYLSLSFSLYHLLLSKRVMCLMWLKQDLVGTVRLKEQER